MSVGNRLVKDSCLECKNISKMLEFGVCSCNNDYAKDKSQAELSWLARHGKTRNNLLEIQKPLRRYSMAEIEEPLMRVLDTMQSLVDEGEKLCTVTKAVSQKAQRHKTRIKIQKSKARAKSSVKSAGRSKAHLEQGKKTSLKKSDDFVVLGVLDGLKGRELENWVEKRAGV